MEPLVALVVIVWGAGTALASYFRDLRTGLSTVTQEGSPEERMAELERKLAVADLIVLAVLADGEVPNEEWERLCKAFAESRLGVDPVATAARFRAQAAELQHPEILRDRITRTAVRLGPPEREEAFRLIVGLARGGSGIAVTHGVGYRAVARSDPHGLIEIFADTLQVPPEARERILEAAER